jgi:hypothetical protein
MMLARFNFSDDINSKFLTNNYVEEPSARGEKRILSGWATKPLLSICYMMFPNATGIK